jgi:predicted AlkP superfamily phosphohydrolase/phosphomutase
MKSKEKAIINRSPRGKVSRKKRVCVISLDGVPGELLVDAFSQGRLTALRSLWESGGWVEITSTLPPVSAVAWATYATGVGPGQHGVYGFADWDPIAKEIYLLTSHHLGVPTLWDRLGEMGCRSVILNLPLTYPARPLSGWLIAGFPAPELSRAAYPPALAARLAQDDYLVDPDPRTATEPSVFFPQARQALASRRRWAWELLTQPWDFFHLHIMVTDRLHHFYYPARRGGEQHQAFWGLYEEIADLVGELAAALPRGVELVLMSDHGFCDLSWELDLNAWLLEKGWLELRGEGEGPGRVAPGSRAYALTPGRIYLRQREGAGELTEALSALTTPDGGPAISQVVLGEEIYQGPQAARGPDLLALPAPGVELRGGWGEQEPFRPAPRPGGHTWEGAFVWIRDHQPRPGNLLDLPPTLWRLLGLRPAPEFQGQALI